MNDELKTLKQVGADVGLPSRFATQQGREALMEAIRTERGPDSRWAKNKGRSRRWMPRAALVLGVFVAAVVSAVAILSSGNGLPGDLVGRAYAAIKQDNGVMHYLVEYTGPGIAPNYEEYWINLNDPSQERIIQTSHTGIVHQIVYTGGYSKIQGDEGANHDPTTVVTKAPPLAGGNDPASQQGINPVSGYGQVLKLGEVLSQGKTTFDGAEAFRFVVRMQNLNEIQYTVDAKTYFPLEYVLVAPVGRLTERFLRFEILPPGPAAEALLRPVDQPQPFHG